MSQVLPSGTATVIAGATTVTVTHSLGYAPTLTKIMLQPQDDIGGRTLWADTATATTFVINMSSMDIADHIIGWLINQYSAAAIPTTLYCNADLVKALSQIQYQQVGYASDSDYEDFINQNLIPHASKIIDSYVGHGFGTPTAGTFTYDGSGKEVLFLPINNSPFLGVSAGSINSVGVTASDVKIHDQYLELDGGVFTKGKQNVVFYGSYGYATMPSDIQFSCAQLSANMLSDMVRRKVYPDLFMPMSANGGDAGVLMANPKVFTAAIKDLLDPYKLTSIDIG
jgi:hypothetical protein